MECMRSSEKLSVENRGKDHDIVVHKTSALCPFYIYIYKIERSGQLPRIRFIRVVEGFSSMVI